MELLKTQTKIDFMAQRKLAMILSGVLLLVSLVSFGLRGLNFGIDFTGGTLIEVGYPQTADLVRVRTDLAAAGFPEALRAAVEVLAPRGVACLVGSAGAGVDVALEMRTRHQARCLDEHEIDLGRRAAGRDPVLHLVADRTIISVGA